MRTIPLAETYGWLAPYVICIIALSAGLLVFKIFENWYTKKYDKPLYRNFIVYRKLSPKKVKILETEFDFYGKLSSVEKRQFNHRISCFVSDKKFVGRDGFVVTDRVEILVAAVGCMLSFGRKNFEYNLVENILIYPEEFYSAINDADHKGEFNPMQKALVLSWKDFEEGYQITNDNRNLGLHEFMHAMQIEAMKERDVDSTRFARHFQNILKRLTHQEVKDKLDETRFFREYAFTNQFEFMAVLTEYFFESPTDFKTHFPELYVYTQKLLNFKFAGY